MAVAKGKSRTKVQPPELDYPRMPSRSNGARRFEMLVDATEAALSKGRIRDIGLYEIAAEANVAPASVYYFFPSSNAALVALARRYLGDLNDRLAEPMDHDKIESWLDILRIVSQRTAEYFSEHPVADRLLLRTDYVFPVREVLLLANRDIANTIKIAFNRHFEFDEPPELDRQLEIMVTMHDAIMSLGRTPGHDRSDDFVQDAVVACMAYMKDNIPDRISRRTDARLEEDTD